MPPHLCESFSHDSLSFLSPLFLPRQAARSTDTSLGLERGCIKLSAASCMLKTNCRMPVRNKLFLHSRLCRGKRVMNIQPSTIEIIELD